MKSRRLQGPPQRFPRKLARNKFQKPWFFVASFTSLVVGWGETSVRLHQSLAHAFARCCGFWKNGFFLLLTLNNVRTVYAIRQSGYKQRDESGRAVTARRPCGRSSPQT